MSNQGDIIKKLKQDMEIFKQEVYRRIEIERMDRQNIILGTVYRYVIRPGFHGVMVQPDNPPPGIDPAEIYLIGAPLERGLNGAIIPLEQSPETISQMFGDPLTEMRGERVEVKFKGSKPFTGTARIVNNYNKEDPDMFIRPEKCMNMLISVSAE